MAHTLVRRNAPASRPGGSERIMPIPNDHPEPAETNVDEVLVRTSTASEIDPRSTDRRSEAELEQVIEASTRRLQKLAQDPVPIEEEIGIA